MKLRKKIQQLWTKKKKKKGENTYLKTCRYRFQLVFGDFDLTTGHVGRLLGIERIRYAARHKHIQLDAFLSFLFFAFLFLLDVGLVLFARDGRRR